VGGATARPDQRPLYSGCVARRLSCRARRCAAITVTVLLALAGSGCSYRLGGFFDDKAEQTGSLKPVRATENETAAALPADQDLALTKAAVHDVLSRDDQNTSVPWENPRTGARGTVTAIATAYTQDGVRCRDFLASYVRDGAESWLQGEACRAQKGKWEVKALRRLQRT
jgi:surface antigen